MKFSGRVIKYGDNIDTDIIIPARYLNTTDLSELAEHCFEDVEKRPKSGDIILAGENFGCGSSREHAPLSIKAVGVPCIIAKSFSRIFYRNAINIGFPIFECENIEDFKENDVIEIDTECGIIFNKTKDKFYKIPPFPEFIQKIIKSRGLINYLKKK